MSKASELIRIVEKKDYPKKPSFDLLKKKKADFYVEFEEETGEYGVFDTEVSFCWITKPSEDAAEKEAEKYRKLIK